MNDCFWIHICTEYFRTELFYLDVIHSISFAFKYAINLGHVYSPSSSSSSSSLSVLSPSSPSLSTSFKYPQSLNS